MAYTRITNTRNGAAAIRYAFEEPSHNPAMDRVLAASGSNLDPKFAMMQMRDTWKAFGKNDGDTVQMYRIIQSFGLDELDPNNPDDVAKANEIGQALASELYPDRQALIVTQADGEGGKLHNHVLVNSVSFVDGKSLRGYMKEHETVSEKSDEIIQRYGLAPIDSEATRNKRTSQEKRLAESGKYVWKDDLRERIAEGLADPAVTSQDAFIEHMRDAHGVTVKWEDGRKNITYSFEDPDGKARKSRDNKLGTDYGKESVSERFEMNVVAQQKTIAQQTAQPPQGVPSVGSGGFDLDAELNALTVAQKPRRQRQRKAPEMTEDIRLTMEQMQADREAKAQQEEMARQAHAEAQRQAELQAEREEQARQAQIEQARREQEERERQAEQERQRQLERDQALERIKSVTTPRMKVTPQFVDRFIESSKELDGKTHATVSGKQVPYSDLDIYRHTTWKIADERRQEQASQQAVAEHIEDAGPDL